MEFIIPNFHLIPYTRFTGRGKFVVPKARKYLDNQESLAWLLKAAMFEQGWNMLPSRAPLYVKWSVNRSGPRYKVDFDNCLKAIVDAAQGVVFPDDRYIVKDLGGELVYCQEDRVSAAFGLVADL